MKNIKRILSISFILVAFVLLFGTPLVKAEANKVDVSVTATLNGDNKEVDLVTSNLDYGSNLVVNFGEDTDHFAFWIVDGVVRKDLKRDTTFVVTNDLDALAVFTDDKTVTVFIDHNGKKLDVNYDGSDTSVVPNKVGFTFVGFDEIFNEESVVIKKATYELAQGYDEEYYFVTYIGEEQDIFDSPYNSVVELNETSQTFTHWEENGKLVSYDPNYKFSLLSERDLIAKSDGDSATTLVTLNELEGYRQGYTSYIGQVELHNGDVLVEHGLEVDGVLKNQVHYTLIQMSS